MGEDRKMKITSQIIPPFSLSEPNYYNTPLELIRALYYYTTIGFSYCSSSSCSPAGEGYFWGWQSRISPFFEGATLHRLAIGERISTTANNITGQSPLPKKPGNLINENETID
jgi:hypothetical protein